MPHSCNGLSLGLAQFSQVGTTDIAKLGTLEMVPQPLYRVEVRRIDGQLDEVQALGSTLGEELYDEPTAMGG